MCKSRSILLLINDQLYLYVYLFSPRAPVMNNSATHNN